MQKQYRLRQFGVELVQVQHCPTAALAIGKGIKKCSIVVCYHAHCLRDLVCRCRHLCDTALLLALAG